MLRCLYDGVGRRRGRAPPPGRTRSEGQTGTWRHDDVKVGAGRRWMVKKGEIMSSVGVGQIEAGVGRWLAVGSFQLNSWNGRNTRMKICVTLIIEKPDCTVDVFKSIYSLFFSWFSYEWEAVIKCFGEPWRCCKTLSNCSSLTIFFILLFGSHVRAWQV